MNFVMKFFRIINRHLFLVINSNINISDIIVYVDLNSQLGRDEMGGRGGGGESDEG